MILKKVNKFLVMGLFFMLVFALGGQSAQAKVSVKESEELKYILTVEPALSFTFGEVKDDEQVEQMLDKLAELNIKGTFFVTELEMLRSPHNIKKIIADGHEIGLAIRPKDGTSVSQVKELILRTQKMLKEKFNRETKLFKQPWGKISQETYQAIAELDCILIGQSLNLMQTKHQNYDSAEQIMVAIFKPSMLALARGDILYFRLDFYKNKKISIDLVEKVKQAKIDNIAYEHAYDNLQNNKNNNSAYKIKPVGAILGETKLLYNYPAEPKLIPDKLQNDSNGIKITEENLIQEISKRYIGNVDITPEDRMLGFSKMEARRFDIGGKIKTKEKVIFLSFDDWGSDAAINKLLYVLRKHNVKATFFILTNNVLLNTNLLRSIAVEGHDIASHSDKHKPMSIRDLKTGRQIPTSSKEEYLKEYKEAYIKLRDVTGDVIVEGKPALTRFFRPPTLAISRDGMSALFETSYTNVVCGSGNMYDYKAKNVEELMDRFKEVIYTPQGKVQNGAILIFHMSDVCAYTAMAIDILLTANEYREANDPKKFKVGRLSDYLTEEYLEYEGKAIL